MNATLKRHFKLVSFTIKHNTKALVVRHTSESCKFFRKQLKRIITIASQAATATTRKANKRSNYRKRVICEKL